MTAASRADIDPLTDDAASILRFRRMGLQDLRYVADSHLKYFPEGFIAKLGPRFLRRYYRTFLDGPLSTALIAEVEGEPVGYLVGVFRSRDHRSLLLRHHGVGLVAVGISSLAARPVLALGFCRERLIRYVRVLSSCWSSPTATGDKQSTGASGSDSERSAILVQIAVEPAHRCQGAGTRLVSLFLDEARRAQCVRACLVTRAGERGAGAFYSRQGWRNVTADGSAPFMAFEFELSVLDETG